MNWRLFLPVLLIAALSNAIRLERDDALAEAERDIAKTREMAQQAAVAVASEPETTQPAASRSDKNDSDHDGSKTDRPFDMEDMAKLDASKDAKKPVTPALSLEDMLSGKGSSLNDLLVPSDEKPFPKFSTTEELVGAVKALEQAILRRPPSEQSLTDTITEATKTGEIVKIFPRIPLRTGLKPGVLPGLVDTAVTSAAALQPLIGDSLSRNVERVSQLQANPDELREVQAGLPAAMPDMPQLHPLSQFRQAVLNDKMNGVNTPVSMDGPPVPALLETNMHAREEVEEEVEDEMEDDDEEQHRHHHHRHQDADLRKDQAVDLQYLRGIGQGVEMLAELFGSADPEAQKKLFQVSAALKNMGANAEDPLAPSLLELGTAQAFEAGPNASPIAGYSVGSRMPDSVLAPSTYAVVPSMPQGAAPLVPKDELSWMVGGPEQKGLVLDAGKNPPERVDFKRLMDSFKAILRKGQKAIEMADRATGQEDPNYKNRGFEGWPQPFWWTRPPNWLDDIPTWMQRLQMKKASSMHRSTPFQ